MNAVCNAHPPRDRLQAYGLGRLSSIESAEVEEHVADCDTCCEALKSLADDSFVSLLRASEAGALQPAAIGEPLPQQGQPASPTIPYTPPGGVPRVKAATFSLAAGETMGSAVVDAPVPPLSGVPKELAEHARYHVVDKLGSGGMGAVYRAEHRLMERPVALKVINPHLLDRPEMVQRFQREVKAAARLAHPNIATAYDAEHVGAIHFLVMEFIPGKDLASLVAEEGLLDVVRACDYMRQAALGLAHAHLRGMVHRDIKPHNLMLTPEGQIKILDFGLAHFASENMPGGGLTDSGSVMGTPDYIAPEQARDAHRADIRADIYSLGCTLYFLLVGHPPFPDGTFMGKLSAHLEREPMPVSELRKGIPPDLVAVLNRMMAKDRALRYQTPAEVATALAPFASEGPASGPATAPGPTRRRTWIAAAVLLALVGPIGYLLGPAIYRIATNQGQLVIETSDPDVEVVVKQDGQQIKIIDTKTEKEINLKAGTYQLELTEGSEGLRLSTNEFTLTRGDKEIVRVRLEAGAASGPTLIEPAVGAVLDNGRRDRGDPIEWKFDWSDVPDATHYHLVVHRGAQRPTIDKQDLTSSEYRHASDAYILNEHREGWSWRVRAEINGKWGPWSDERTFDVELLDTDPRRADAQDDEVRRFEGHTDWVFDVAISPDGRRALSAGREGVARLWDMATGKELRKFDGHTNEVFCVAFLPDGRRVLTGSLDRTLRLWDVETGKELRKFEGHGAGVGCLAVSSDGRRVLSGGEWQGGDASLRLWDVETGKELRKFEGHTEGVTEVALSPDGRRALSTSYDKTVRLWDVETGREIRRFGYSLSRAHGVAFSPDGRQAASGTWDNNPMVRLWDVETGEQIRVFSASHGIQSVAFSPDGTRLLASTWDKELRLWDVQSGELLRTFAGYTDVVEGIAFSPDGRFALAGSRDKTLRLWQMPDPTAKE